MLDLICLMGWGLFGRRGIDPKKLQDLKSHELAYIDHAMAEHARTHALYLELKKAIERKDFKKIKRLSKEISREDALQKELLEKIDHIEKIKDRDRGRLAEDILDIMKDISSELFKEVSNPFRESSNRNYYIRDLLKGESPVFYMDASGVVRMVYYKGKFKIIKSGEIPSKISGKSVAQVWDDVRHKYEHHLRLLMDALGVE